MANFIVVAAMWNNYKRSPVPRSSGVGGLEGCTLSSLSQHLQWKTHNSSCSVYDNAIRTNRQIPNSHDHLIGLKLHLAYTPPKQINQFYACSSGRVQPDVIAGWVW
jgi:hypothetical protein